MKSDDMEACSEALYLLATTVDGVESWLWPCLISALLDSACIASVNNDFICQEYSSCIKFHAYIRLLFFSLSVDHIRATFIISISSKNNTCKFFNK